MHEEGYKSKASSQSLSSEGSGDLPPVSPLKPTACTKAKHSRASKDRQTKHEETGPSEPILIESLLEDKILGILSKTLPQMLSRLFQETMGQPKPTPTQVAPTVAPVMDVPMPSPPPQIPLD